MPSPQLENIGMALQGLGAGLGGQLPQFLQMQNQRQGLQRQEQMDNLMMAEKRQQMAIERQKTMFTDANSALQLVDQGNLDGVVRLGIQRLQMLKQLSELDPSIDPSDTQRVTRLAIAARNGDPEALENLKGELSNTVQMGQAIGVLTPPEVSTKVVGSYLVDDKTGKVIFDASEEGPRERAQDENGVLRYVDDGARVFPEVVGIDKELSSQDRFTRADTLRKEISTANKDFTQIANSWDRIAASSNDPSAAGDLALIFNFMKMLDPGSTVREGEFATAQNAAGIPTRIRNAFNNAQNGERLAEVQRADFFNQAQNIFTASKGRADAITDEYVRLGGKYGLERDDIVIDRGASPEISVTPASEIVEITTQEERDALPSGAEYMYEGVKYRRP